MYNVSKISFTKNTYFRRAIKALYLVIWLLYGKRCWIFLPGSHLSRLQVAHCQSYQVSRNGMFHGEQERAVFFPLFPFTSAHNCCEAIRNLIIAAKSIKERNYCVYETVQSVQSAMIRNKLWALSCRLEKNWISSNSCALSFWEPNMSQLQTK